jgi:hypothetical protein
MYLWLGFGLCLFSEHLRQWRSRILSDANSRLKQEGGVLNNSAEMAPNEQLVKAP